MARSRRKVSKTINHGREMLEEGNSFYVSAMKLHTMELLPSKLAKLVEDNSQYFNVRHCSGENTDDGQWQYEIVQERADGPPFPKFLLPADVLLGCTKLAIDEGKGEVKLDPNHEPGPKRNTSATPASTKKRGRPSTGASKKTPKKTGKPKKEPKTTSVGRPKKKFVPFVESAESTEPPPNADGPPEDSVVTDTDSDAPAPKKKAGRPKKDSSTPKPTKKQKESATTPNTEGSKKRGRPKGSGKKKPEEPEKSKASGKKKSEGAGKGKSEGSKSKKGGQSKKDKKDGDDISLTKIVGKKRKSIGPMIKEVKDVFSEFKKKRKVLEL
mmetsp:Transcript_36742/g.63777  ORF Transcript_36742/g.63777 Transcript_36742/m.63777 type:complete len:326 (+) Transcript_36742:153-1130(+)